MSSLGQFIGNLLSPTEAEAKVVYGSPSLETVSQDIAQGRASINPADLDPSVLRYMQHIIQKSQAVPQEAFVNYNPDMATRYRGQATTYPALYPITSLRGLTDISIRPDLEKEWRERTSDQLPATLVHELSHFLMNFQPGSGDVNKASDIRQHAAIYALFSHTADKDTLVRGFLKSQYPQVDPGGPFFKKEHSDIMNTLKLLMEPYKAQDEKK